LHLEGARSKSEVRLDNLDTLGEDLLGFLSGDAGVDDNIITLLPVTGSGDAVLVTELERVNNAKDLIKVTASGGRVGQNETDALLGVNDEDRADSEGNTLSVNVSNILNIKHACQFRNPCNEGLTDLSSRQ
jgi:hypothetical protein